jgi:SM-20-related protein
MIDLTRISKQVLQTEPYCWAEIDDLFTPEDAAALAEEFPYEHFKTVVGDDGEKAYEYEARALIGMGADTISFPEELTESWLALAQDLISAPYRAAMSLLTSCDLTEVPVEVNVFHYGPGARLGAHADLKDKIVTHVLYFNQAWNRADGGCLSILRSKDPADVVAEIGPIVGNSAVLVRSENSWHSVAPVANGCQLSRRSLTATFYRPGSISTMWPPGDNTPLHRYGAKVVESNTTLSSRLRRRLRRLLG